jgi:Flp pilus assembly protein TadG
MSWPRESGNRIREDRGAQLVEFILILPILLILVFGIINFGFVFGQKLSLNQAVREGARKAVVSSTATQPDVEGFVRAATGGLIPTAAPMTVTTAIQTKTGSPPTFQPDFDRAGTCLTYTDTEGLGGQLRVQAQYQATWLLPPFLPISAPNLTSEAVFRCEVI